MLHYTITEEYYKVKLLINSDDICDFMELSKALALQRNTFIVSVNMFYKVLVCRPEMKGNVLKCAVILLSCKIMENFRGLSFIVEAAGNHFNVEPDRDDITLMEMDISEMLNFDYKYVDYYTYCGSKTLLIARDKSMLVYVFSFLTDCCFLPLLMFFRKKDVVFACIFLALKVLKSDIFKCGENAGPGIDQEVAAAMTLGMKISTDESSLDSTPVIQDIAIENKRRKLFYKNTRKAHKLKEKLFKKYRPHLRVEPEFLHDLEMAFKGFEYSAVEIHFICKELLDFYAKML